MRRFLSVFLNGLKIGTVIIFWNNKHYRAKYITRNTQILGTRILGYSFYWFSHTASRCT